LQAHGPDAHSLALRRNEFMPTFNAVVMWLETGIKLMDKKKVIEAL
jgi:hypothetical protein